MNGQPFIPANITVHLGRPDAYAQNVTVTFPDYIKNVASSEIYPTWPENALRANIYAQISFALNRIYTEWYRSRGYDFDITNSTQFDQAYVQGRDIYENISQIVDEIFNDYLQRQGFVEPLFAQFCNGTTVTCEGLSQWGTVALADQGYTPYSILTNYYGDDINIVTDAPVAINSPSFPGVALGIGKSGNDVKTIQVRLNRISRNYPKIPKIYPVDGIYGQETADAVTEFQRIFNLTPDGIVGKATWWKIAYIFTTVKRLSELDSEGLRLEEVSRQFPSVLREGTQGNGVRVLQYYLSVVSAFYEQVPPIAVDGFFGPMTKQAVIAFQKVYGLAPDGVVGRNTWNELVRAYRGILESVPPEVEGGGVQLFPGLVLKIGITDPSVRTLQEYLSFIADTYPEIPKVPATGYFGEQTRDAVIAFQNRFGLNPDGVVGAVTWDAIASEYSDLRYGFVKRPGQFPGYNLSEE